MPQRPDVQPDMQMLLPSQPGAAVRTGRRRLAVFGAVGIAVGLLVSLALIVVGLFTGSPTPVPRWPEPSSRYPVEEAVTDADPSPTPDGPTASRTGPTAAPTRGPAPRPAAPTSATPTGTQQPSPGDKRRVKPGKTPGKPTLGATIG